MDLTFDPLDLDQKPVRIEVMIRQDTVELHHQRRLVGSTDRSILRKFITTPVGEFAYDDTRWIEHDPGLWLCIGHNLAQPLTDPQLADLRSKL